MHQELEDANWNIMDYVIYAPSEEFVIKPGEACLTTTMESGYVRKRRVLSQVFDTTTIKWSFPSNLIRLFRLWFAYETNQGQKWFVLKLPTGFYNNDATCIEQIQCQFVAPPTISKSGGNWNVTGELRMIGDNGARVTDANTLEPLPARNTWDDTNAWEETL